MELVAFYIFASLSVLGGVLMVAHKNPLRGAFALVLSLASVAALFAMLHAEFVFILQILLYAGAIMVLVIFTIMLLNLSKEELQEPPVGKLRTLIMFVATLIGLIGFIRVLRMLPHEAGPLPDDFGNIEPVGELMLSSYLYPFEIISVLLLVALVGVVLLAKKTI